MVQTLTTRKELAMKIENEFEERIPELEAKIMELYPLIHDNQVVKSGGIYIDTDEQQTGIFFNCGQGDEFSGYNQAGAILAKVPNDLTGEDIQNIFYAINHAFESGIRIGIRESLRLAREHMRLRKEKNLQLSALVEALEITLSDTAAYGLKTDIIEAMTFVGLNPEGVEGKPWKDVKKWRLDLTMAGNAEEINFLPDTIEKLNALAQQVERKKERIKIKK